MFKAEFAKDIGLKSSFLKELHLLNHSIKMSNDS